MIFGDLHDWLEFTFNLPLLIIGLIVWPGAVDLVYLLFRMNGLI